MVAQHPAGLVRVVMVFLTELLVSVSPAAAFEWIRLPDPAPYPFLGPLLFVVCVVGFTYLAVERWRRQHLRRKQAPGKQKEMYSVYDPLTGLPTRRLFLSLLGRALTRAERTGRTVAVLIVQLEHFTVVAESQGRAGSDMVIRVQAARLKSALRSTDTIARLMPDQFGVVLENLVSADEILPLARRMQEIVGLPLTLEGHELLLSCRMGVALYPNNATDRDRLIDVALRALSIAKAQEQSIHFSLSEVEPASASTPVSLSAVDGR
ncbi:MAG: GGDEF domain-containing protein [Nitrospirota bacterium]